MSFVHASPLGDIVSDLATMAAAAASYQERGAIGPWIARRLAEFRDLPGAMATLRRQWDGVRRVVGDTPEMQQVGSILTDVDRRYPAVAAQVNALTATLAPVWAKVYAGTYDGDVVAALSAHGVDVVRALSAIGDLLADRDRARQALQVIVTDPTLTDAQRTSAIAALGDSGLAWWKVAVLGAIAFVVLRAVWK